MTLAQTRQLGIEVERRLQTILPTLKIENKIDTEDIYAFLNQFQKLYIDAIYKQGDQIESGTRQAIAAEDLLRTLTSHITLSSIGSDDTLDINNKVYNLPLDYYRYIKSVSKITSNYKSGSANTTASNALVKQSDANKIINQYYDKGRILRNPVVVLEGSKTNATGILKVIHDEYTTVTDVDLTYIKLPEDFSILTGVACQLPYTCFEDLVAGATELYMNHLLATQPKQRKEVKNDEA